MNMNHKSARVLMEIISKTSGVARVVKVLEGEGMDLGTDFRAARFTSHDEGTIMECKFRIGSTRNLLSAMVREDLMNNGHTQSPAPQAPQKPALKMVESMKGWQSLGNVYIPDEQFELLEAVVKFSEDMPVNILLVGQPGTAKTSVLQQLAKENGMEYFRWDCSTVRDPEEWFLYREAQGGSTITLKNELAQAIERGNVIINLDEANRLNPKIWASMFPILDDARRTMIHDTEIVVGDRVIFGLTANIGYQFVGTYEIDSAILSRVAFTIETTLLPKELEATLLVLRTGIDLEKAMIIANGMDRVRQAIAQNGDSVDASPRSTINIARLARTGLPIQKCFIAALYVSSSYRKDLSDLFATMNFKSVQ